MKKSGWWIVALVPFMLLTNADVRDYVAQGWKDSIAWMRTLRTGDPMRKLIEAERDLQRELPRFAQARGELSEQQRKLRETHESAQQLREHAETLIEEFRAAYKQAEQCGSFPIVIRDRAYTQDQAKAQVELLVAQLEQRDLAIAKTQAALEAATQQSRELAATETRAEQEIAILPLRRTIAKAEQLHSRTDELVGEIEQTTQDGPVSKDPVRTLDELLKAEAAAASRAHRITQQLID